MKHSDFSQLIHAIKKREYDELYRAVEAHGGIFAWWDEETESFKEDIEHPIIAVNAEGLYPNPVDVEVRSVEIYKGTLCIEGEDKEYGNRMEFEPSDAFAGHLSFIIDLIPETAEVDDVSNSERLLLYDVRK